MGSISEKEIYDLIGLIYETTQHLSSEPWLDVYKKMSALLSSGAGGLSLYSHINNEFDLVATTLDTELLKEYDDYYQFISPFRKKIVEMNAGEVFIRSNYMSDKDFLKSEIYQDYFKRQDVFDYQHQVLYKDKQTSGGVTFSRPEKMENFGKNEIGAIKILMPHLQRAFQVYVKIAEIERDKRLLIECLGKVRQGIIVLNKSGQIVFANDTAEKIIAEKDGFNLNRNGVLLTGLAQETKKLKHILQSVFKPDISRKINFGGIMQVSRSSGSRPFSILISPFSEPKITGFGSDVFALLFICDPEQKVETVEPVLQEIYGLTVAESKIAAILAQGNSLNEACELLKIKPNTIRTHLKRIFSKTETNRQSELVKLILNSPAILRRDKIIFEKNGM